MCKYKELFITYKTTSLSIITANNAKMEAIGVGTVKIAVLNKTLVLYNVLYIPSLYTNLLSIPQVIENKAKVEFSKDICKIIYLPTAEVIIEAIKIGKLYILNTLESIALIAKESLNT